MAVLRGRESQLLFRQRSRARSWLRLCAPAAKRDSSLDGFLTIGERSDFGSGDLPGFVALTRDYQNIAAREFPDAGVNRFGAVANLACLRASEKQIGRASCRERGWG